MKKILDMLLTIFAYGITVCLFAGGLSFLGYLIGVAIGGETAVNLCTWIFKAYLPWVVRATSGFTGIGLLGMYLNKQKALTAEVGRKVGWKNIKRKAHMRLL